jgi:hypothetical protein
VTAIGIWDELIIKPLDEVIASTTTQDDDDFHFVTVAGKVYEIVLFVAVLCSSTVADIKFQMGENTNTKTGWVTSAGTTTTDGAHGTAIPNTLATPIAFGGSTFIRCFHFDGSFLGQGGTWKWRWACNSSGTTTVKAGSIMRYRRVDNGF